MAAPAARAWPSQTSPIPSVDLDAVLTPQWPILASRTVARSMSHELPRITTINPNDSQDLALWALVFAVTPATVLAAVSEVGTDPERVLRYLRGDPPKRSP
ncbi:DUF3606 domain-containing protein [Luteibacter yeojuensis]|uniref:DUF3606 domain-containing protein n=1 Tax=Luteibacter yeojuensis TaxID=345309 RepID=UPI0009FE4463